MERTDTGVPRARERTRRRMTFRYAGYDRYAGYVGYEEPEGLSSIFVGRGFSPAN